MQRNHTVHFFIPEKVWPIGELPRHAGEYHEWFLDAHRKFDEYMAAYQQPEKAHLIEDVQKYLRYYQLGRYDWILLNYLHLKDAGYDAELVSQIPDEGIVVSHRAFLTEEVNASPKTFMICCMGDRVDEFGEYKNASLTIVENRSTQQFDSRGKFTHYFMPHRSQFGMIPRDPDRGNQFRNVHYFGEPCNLALPFHSREFSEHLRDKLDLDFQFRLRDRWHDYHDTDCIIAVRSVDGHPFNAKPPTKMYNAWLAGVPAILGPESAFLSEGKVNFDFLLARSSDEVFACLQRLKVDVALRNAIVDNGKKRAIEISDPAITNHWIKLLDTVAKPMYESAMEQMAVPPVSVPDSFNIKPPSKRTNQEVFFFIPPEAKPLEDVPTTAAQYYPWYQEANNKWLRYRLAGPPSPNSPIENVSAYEQYWQLGLYDSTLQTYLNLKDRGYPCHLVFELPDEGIVIGPRKWLTDDLNVPPKTLIVNNLMDRGINQGYCPYAGLTVVQNRADVRRLPSGRFTHYFIPFWTQAGLIPRDPNRGDEFRNVHFFGEPINLAGPLLKHDCRDWFNRYLGLDFEIKPRGQWHDYSETDCVIAVRSFDKRLYHYKPATKLFNGWMAGVPVIVGGESSFRAERRGPFDYIEVADGRELIAVLQRMKTDPAGRRAMVENGRRRAPEVTHEAISQKWIEFLEKVAKPTYDAIQMERGSSSMLVTSNAQVTTA